MRRFLLAVVINVAFVASWLLAGRQLSLVLDRFRTAKIASASIKSLAYEGNGTGGTLFINDLRLSLRRADSKSAEPNVGTTKGNQLALSFGGKVFSFGQLRTSSEGSSEKLDAEIPSSDEASLSTEYGILFWPTRFEHGFVKGRSPSWKQHQYYRLNWKKQNGTKLEMLWRFEHSSKFFEEWPTDMLTSEGTTGLIRVEIPSPLPSPQSSP